MAGYRAFDIPRFRGDLAAAAEPGALLPKSPKAGISQISMRAHLDDPSSHQ
jgi:hypothetical protein